MTAAASLINLLGFITGTALYAMLLAMVLNEARPPASSAKASGKANVSRLTDRLPLLTALLGLVWNLGALLSYGLYELRGSGLSTRPVLLVAVAFTALGFLPAVVVNSVLRTEAALKTRPKAVALVALAYLLSGVAGTLHLYVSLKFTVAPSHWGLHTLTFGFGFLILVLLVATRGEGFWRRAGWVIALAVFAVSAQHLSHHEGLEYPLWVELIGHHASLPLAVAILYQDYRFALADIFLKRAFVLVLLVALAFGLYLGIAAPLLEAHIVNGRADPIAIGALLALWVVTALVFPALRQFVDWIVDSLLLRRADYDALRAEIAERIAMEETPEAVLDEVSRRLSHALTARDVRWSAVDGGRRNVESSRPAIPLLPTIDHNRNSRRLKELPRGESTATVTVPTADLPQYNLLIGELSGGRRLLSDDLAMLETVAVMTARRIDAVRVIHERCLRDLHEQEIHKLATQAELRALRAQINPHFLFNALTTLGYLIQTAPDRAQETLMSLTMLLRGVLRRPDGEFTTLGEEIELIESYLEIERARFEDRLQVRIDIPEGLHTMRIPALLIQPLVENAIKHGISPSRAGGEVTVEARMSNSEANPNSIDKMLQIIVRDTGVGATEIELSQGRKRGVGLTNVEQRLLRHYGDEAFFSIRTARGIGARVEMMLPINPARTMAASTNGASTEGDLKARRQA